MRPADPRNPTAPLEASSDTQPRAGPWKLMLSTDSVYFGKLYQHEHGPSACHLLTPGRLHPPCFLLCLAQRGSRALCPVQGWGAALKILLTTASV